MQPIDYANGSLKAGRLDWLETTNMVAFSQGSTGFVLEDDAMKALQRGFA
jgi:hypothetical protein